MAPIQFFFASALMFSAAFAAPINTNPVSGAEAGRFDAALPINHQSEPMRKADPVMSSIPAATIDAQAVASSAAAGAFLPPNSNQQQDGGISSILNNLPIGSGGKNTRRQLDAITSLLTSLNKIGKRREEKFQTRQLGLIKSVPEAAGQLAHVANVAESLPIKRAQGSGILGGLGGLGGVLGGSVKRDAPETDTNKPSYTEKALSGFRGMLHHSSSKAHEKEEAPPSTQSLGLGQIVKRNGEDAPLSSAEKAKLEEMVKRGSGDPLGSLGALVSGLGILGKRGDGNPLDILDELTSLFGILRKRGEDLGSFNDDALLKSLSRRQLDILSTLATASLSNAGAAAGQLGKLATGKHRRDHGDAEDSTAATMQALTGVGKGKVPGIGDETGASGIADEFLDGQKDAQVASGALSKATSMGLPLAKRQVPPIAGSDALSVLKGVLADPSSIAKPVTEGILLGGSSIGDLATPP